MEFKKILLENKDGIGVITLNSPKNLNAMDGDFLKEINAAFELYENDDTVDVIVITGTGRAFVAGADIKYMSTLTPDEAKAFAGFSDRMMRHIELMDKVVIAAVNGMAFGGGCELSLCCDLRYASNKAVFGLPEVTLGVIPGSCGTQRMPRAIGMAMAKELIFTGRNVKADEAKAIGLVNAVFDDETLMDEVMKIARRIQGNSLNGIKKAKESINRGMQMDMDSAMANELNLFALCFAHPDQKEGMNAFVEKRKAEFKK